MVSKTMTHGELVYHVRQNLDFTLSVDSLARSIEKQIRKSNRMPRVEAIEYYGAKIRAHFGVAKKKVSQAVKDEVSIKDFLKVEHYYDFHEAQRLLEAV